MPKKPAQIGPKWQPEQRAALAGARRPNPLDPPPPALTREAGWALVCEYEKAMDRGSGAIDFRNPQAKALYQPIADSYSQRLGLLDAQHERLRYELMRWLQVEPRREEGLTALWLGSGGLPFLFDVMHSKGAWRIGSSGTVRNLEAVPIDPYESWGQADDQRLWVAVRRWCFALPEVDFIAARDAAVAWAEREDGTFSADERARIELELGCALARDPSLAHQAAEHLLRDKQAATCASNHAGHYGLARLLASLTDVPLARRFAAGFSHIAERLGPSALDLVESVERDAAELIAPFIARVDAATISQRSKTFWNRPLKAAHKLALTDPRPPTP